MQCSLHMYIHFLMYCDSSSIKNYSKSCGRLNLSFCQPGASSSLGPKHVVEHFVKEPRLIRLEAVVCSECITQKDGSHHFYGNIFAHIYQITDNLIINS